MTAAIATGTLLVLMSWAALTIVLAAVGVPIAAATGRHTSRSSLIRHGLWWGLLAIVLLAYALNLFIPLQGPLAVTVLAVLTAVGAVLSVRVLRADRFPRARRSRVTRPTRLALAVLALPIVVLAIAALGPITNYDSGLYHLGAIRYAADYAAIPGLANLYFPFGYGNAQFPFAALLGAGPWQLEGARLANGLVIVLAYLDLALRWRGGRRGPGFHVLLAGLAVVLVTMVPLADYWVTSPSQDSTVFALTVVASAYLADTVAKRSLASAGTTAALAILLVLHRPTMAAFALTALLVVIVALRRRPTSSPVRRTVVTAAIAAMVAAGLATARDAVLSGWVQYPLSFLPLDVAWRAGDPTAQRLATLGNARDPATYESAATGWGWLGAWAGRLPSQWETWALLLLLLTAGAVTVLAWRSRAGARGRTLLAAMAPSAVASASWFLATPPAYRFAWGPLVTLATIPIGWAAWRLRRDERGGVALVEVGTALALAGVVASATWTAVVRIDLPAIDDGRTWELGISIPYAVAASPITPTVEARLDSGLAILVPEQGEQCWAAWPLCSPQFPRTLRLRGATLQEGLLP